MKTKSILSLSFFVISFFLSVFLAFIVTSKNESPKISQEIKQSFHKKLSSFINDAFENKKIETNELAHRAIVSDPSTFTKPHIEYINKLENMDTSGLPEDFNIVWLQYVQATRKSVDLITNLKSLPENLTLNKEEKELANIQFVAESNAWNNVLSLAKAYGIDYKGN